MTDRRLDCPLESVYTVGDYLLDRLAELGVSEIFGVPGDYNLEFLDHIVAHPDIRWVGNANELNAGYAADGYGRLRGMSAVVTTFGVGELSATNAIAGSYAEHVPVVHIVGGPSKDAQGTRRALHHSLGDGDFEHFLRISREITCAQANLMPATATREIDRVLSEVREQKRPGYLLLATDVARFPTEPPDAPLPRYTGGTSPRALSMFTDAATELIADHQLTVLADLLVHRLQAVKELEALLAADVVPHATLMWGKSLVDESSPNFLGIYAGAASTEAGAPGDRGGAGAGDGRSGVHRHGQRISSASASTRREPSTSGSIRAPSPGKVFAPLEMGAALDALTAILVRRGINFTPGRVDVRRPRPANARTRPATHSRDVVGQVLRGADSGQRGARRSGHLRSTAWPSHRLPHGVTFIGQPLWGSIGYTLPAALGAGLAHPDRRPVLLIGDGAAQLTVQELGTFSREGLTPVIVVVNNDGYTVERAIHGETAPYNDIVSWNWAEIPARAGRDQSPVVFRAQTYGELDDALTAAAQHQDRMVLVEAVVPRLDIPPLLTELTQPTSADGIRRR